MASIKRTKDPASTKAEGPRTTSATPPNGPAQSTDAVAKRAYELWRQSGGAHGNDQAHWFQAERELRARTTTR